MRLMFGRLTNNPVEKVSDEHFDITDLIQEEFRNLSEKFFEDVDKSVKGDLGPGNN